MASKKTRTASEYLKDITEAEKYQEIDNWRENTQRMQDYLEGDYGTLMYDTKYVANSVYSLINLLMPNLYYQNPFISVNPQKPFFMREQGDSWLKIDGQKSSQLVQSVLNNIIKNIDLEGEVRQVIQDALLSGIGVLKIGYSSNTAYEEDTEYLDEGDIFAQRLSPFDYLFDPMSTGPENARYEIHRFVKTVEEVQDNKTYKNTEDLEGSSLPEYTPKKKKKDESKDDSKWVTLYEYHDHINNNIVTLVKEAKKKRILKTQNNPHKIKGSHFIVLKFPGNNDRFRGISPILTVEDEILAINEVLSLTVNHLQQFPGTIMYEEGALDDDDLDRFEDGEQGDLLQVQNGALREGRIVRTPPLSSGNEYYGALNMLLNLVDRILGVPDFQRAPQSGKRKTAQEVTIEAQDSGIRRSYLVNFVKRFIITTARKLTGLAQQYYTKKQWTLIDGDFPEWMEWTNEDIAGEYSFDFDVENLRIYSSSKAQAIINALQIMAPIQFFSPVWQQLDPMKLAKKLFENMDLNLDSVSKATSITHIERNPYDENTLAMQGHHLPDPHPGEPHEEHIPIHQEVLMQAAADKNQAAYTELARHLQMHMYAMQVKTQIPGNPTSQSVVNPTGSNVPMGGGASVPSEAEAQGGYTNQQALRNNQ